MSHYREDRIKVKHQSTSYSTITDIFLMFSLINYYSLQPSLCSSYLCYVNLTLFWPDSFLTIWHLQLYKISILLIPTTCIEYVENLPFPFSREVVSQIRHFFSGLLWGMHHYVCLEGTSLCFHLHLLLRHTNLSLEVYCGSAFESGSTFWVKNVYTCHYEIV